MCMHCHVNYISSISFLSMNMSVLRQEAQCAVHIEKEKFCRFDAIL